MDKVIDGVDVSGCESYTHNHNELMPYGDIKVTEHYCWHINSNCDGKDCDFKQIKRLQAENEKLKNQYSFSTILKIDELKAENERLKEELNRNGREWENHCNAQYWQMQSIIDKYRQALQEIREILAERIEWTGIPNNAEIEIIDKINEVIGAE